MSETVQVPDYLQGYDFDTESREKKAESGLKLDLDMQVKDPDALERGSERNVKLGELANRARLIRRERLDYKDRLDRIQALVSKRGLAIRMRSDHGRANAANEADLRASSDMCRGTASMLGDKDKAQSLVEVARVVSQQEYGEIDGVIDQNTDYYDRDKKEQVKRLLSNDEAKEIRRMPFSRKKLVLTADQITLAALNGEIDAQQKAKEDREAIILERKYVKRRDMEASRDDIYRALEIRDYRICDAIVATVDVDKIIADADPKTLESLKELWSDVQTRESQRYTTNEQYMKDRVLPGANVVMARMEAGEGKASGYSTAMTDEERDRFAVGIALVKQGTAEEDTAMAVIGQALAEESLSKLKSRISRFARSQGADGIVASNIVETMTRELRIMFTVRQKSQS